MKERLSDEELDLGLRNLFSGVRQPVAPSALRVYPRSVVAGPRRRGFGGFGHSPRVRGLATVTATLAIVLAVVLAVVIIEPGNSLGAQASPSASLLVTTSPQPSRSAAASPTGGVESPSPGPSASVANDLPARVQSGSFVWTRLSLPTEPNTASWEFFKVSSLTLGGDCHRSGPADMWSSSDDLIWTQLGTLPGMATDDNTCPSAIVWDGSRYVASGTVIHPAKPDVWLPAVWTSTDGMAWTPVSLTGDLPQQTMGPLAFGRGAYVTVIGDSVWRSTDLAHWVKTLGLPSGSANGREPVVRFDGSVFVAAVTGPKGDTFAYWSSDGQKWWRADLGGSIATLVARASGFVAIVSRSDYSMLAMGSPNGSSWSQLSALPVVGGQCDLDMLLCFGAAGITDGFSYSPDGVDWQRVAWAVGLPGSFEYGPSPDPMFVTFFAGSGTGNSAAAVYVIQPHP